MMREMQLRFDSFRHKEAQKTQKAQECLERGGVVSQRRRVRLLRARTGLLLRAGLACADLALAE
jgi:hypothetical protein